MEEKNEWHLLKYTLFAENPENKNEIYCVNLLSGTYFILNREEFNFLFKLSSLDSKSEILKKFIQQGIVINFDEKALMETLARKSCNPSNFVKLTICPTLACNFNCPYCFENHKSGKMSEETQNDIINFLEKTNKKIKTLFVTWYGGEPLLAVDIIQSLSRKLINFSEKNNISYNSNIITNGYLLNQKIADTLKELKVSHYQITLDGIGETHDKTRHLANGNPTFDKIIDNLHNIKIEGNISIRHNIHKGNIKDSKNLELFIQKLKEETGNNIRYYGVPVAGNDVADTREEKVEILSNEEKMKIEAIKDSKHFSRASGHFCGSQTFEFLTIDNEGRLYKCWEDVDKPERSFGNIKTWNFNNPLYSSTNPNPLLNYINTAGVLNDLECQNCILLPLCKGGCPNKRLYYRKKCAAYKDNPEVFVLELIKRLNKNKKIS